MTLQSYSSAHGTRRFREKDVQDPVGNFLHTALRRGIAGRHGRVLAKIYTELVIVESVKIVVWSNAA